MWLKVKKYTNYGNRVNISALAQPKGPNITSGGVGLKEPYDVVVYTHYEYWKLYVLWLLFKLTKAVLTKRFAERKYNYICFQLVLMCL